MSDDPDQGSPRKGLSGYFRALATPRSWNDFADLLSKTLFAAMSAIIALTIWVYSNTQERLNAALELQAQRHASEIKAVRENLSDRRDTINLFLQFLPQDQSDPQFQLKLQTLSSYCSEESSAGRPNRVSNVLCESVGRLGDGFAARTQADASSAAAAASRGNPASYVNSSVANAQLVALAASESGVPATAGHWFAVVASIPLEQRDAVPAIARSLNERLRAGGMPADVQVFRTQISRSFAITSGPEKTEALARARVRALRQAGLVPDAFAQPDRGWVREQIAF